MCGKKVHFSTEYILIIFYDIIIFNKNQETFMQALRASWYLVL